MSTCPTCQTPLPGGPGGCSRCALFAAGSPVMLTVALTPDGGPGMARFDSRYPATPAPVEQTRPPVTPAPDRLLTAAVLPNGSTAVNTVAATPAPSGPTSAPATLLAPPTTPPPPTVTAKLRVIRGARINADYQIYTGRNVVGRFADRPVDIDLTGVEPDGQVWSSRRHAALTLDKSLLVVEDLNSLNGTWVNGTRLRAGAALPLKHGDVIQIGVAQLRVEVELA